MQKKIIFKILFLLLIFQPALIFSQERSLSRGAGGGSQNVSGGVEPGREGSEQKQIKPGIKLWYLNGNGAFKDSTKLDTLQENYHQYNPVFKNTITATYVGNYGTPYLDNNFFNRNSDIDFYFSRTRENYFLTPQKVKYYNTRTPYTLLDFTQSEHRTRKNETRFNVLHTQNVKPWWNFTFRYDQARSQGQYKNQETKNNFVTLYSSYNKDKYSIHGGFISNSLLNNENGGLHKNANLLEEPDTDFLNVNLTSVKNETGSTYFYTTGEYKLGRYENVVVAGEDISEEEDDDEAEEQVEYKVFKPFAGVIYSFEYQNHKKDYVDKEDTISGFFKNAYFGEDYSKDSIRFMMVRNVVQLKHYENPERKTSFGKRAFVGQEFVRAFSPGPVLNVYTPQTKRYSNVYAGGGIFRETGKFWTWNFDGRIFLLGRNIGQTELNGIISKPLSIFKDSLASVKVKGSIVNLVPDYFQQEYYSNRIRWKNDLKMEQRMTANGVLEIPRRKLLLNASYSIINNFIYNNTEGIPDQFGGQLLVLSAYADKDFSFRNLHLRTRVLWQKPSNEDILHLPDISAFVSGYYKFVISKVLYTQLGFDARYNTAFYADAYSPVTGLFYLQNEVKTGDYPFIDVYANLRLKRTKIFFKMMNVGTEFINREYYTSPGYPMNRMTFRMGVAWTFYD